MVDPRPMTVEIPDAEAMEELGERLGRSLRVGDLVVLTGDLGAGKTTLARGIGRGMRIRGQVTSPTFVIARHHRSTVGGPGLVHIDAYRISAEEVHDLELDADLDSAAALVEWGRGKVDDWSAPRLEIEIDREESGGVDHRAVSITASGDRWAAVDWPGILGTPIQQGGTGEGRALGGQAVEGLA